MPTDSEFMLHPIPRNTGDADGAALLKECADLTKALTNLTCGGSEFFIRKGERYTADIKACVDYINRRNQLQHEQILKQARRAAAAEVRAADLLAACRVALEFVGAMPSAHKTDAVTSALMDAVAKAEGRS